MKIIFLFLLLLAPFAARAAEPTEFRCDCDYKWSIGAGKCEENDDFEVELGGKWSVYGVVPKQGGGWEGTTFDGTFSDKTQCSDLLEMAFQKKAVCDYYTCVLKANFQTKLNYPGAPIVADNWLEYYGLKWLTSVGTLTNPIQVKEEEITLPIEIVASGMTSKDVKIDCLNCTDPGVEFKSEPGSGKGKAIIIWDTSKSSGLTTQLYGLKVMASVVGGSDPGILGEVYFSITGVTPVQTKENVDAWIKSQYGKPEDYAGALPDCAFDGSCRSVNDLLELIIKFASGMFMILGSFAFAFFVYGGFKMIISMGNAETVETGKKTMIAAALGLVVALLAYTAIGLMLDILNVNMDFRGIK